MVRLYCQRVGRSRAIDGTAHGTAHADGTRGRHTGRRFVARRRRRFALLEEMWTNRVWKVLEYGRCWSGMWCGAPFEGKHSSGVHLLVNCVEFGTRTMSYIPAASSPLRSINRAASDVSNRPKATVPRCSSEGARHNGA